MITKQKLLDLPLPRKRKVLPNYHYLMQKQKQKLEGEVVTIYTAYQVIDKQANLHFRTFCWTGTFTTWVYGGDQWSRDAGAVNRWSNAMVDKFIHRQAYRVDANGKRSIEPFAKVQGEAMAEQLYQYQSGIRNDALAKKHKKVQIDIQQIMSQLKAAPKDLDRFIVNVPLKNSRYVYYKNTKSKKVKGEAVKVIDGYCTHCEKDFQQILPIPGMLHNVHGKCPCCGSAIQYKAIGKTKNLQDDTRFAFIQRVSNGIAIRGYMVSKTYKTNYRSPTTEQNESFRILISFSNDIAFYHWEWVASPLQGKVYGNCQTGQLSWRKYGYNCFNFLSNAYLYTKNLRYVLAGTPWQYSGIAEFARKYRQPFFIEDYFLKYETCPSLEYLSKLGFSRLIGDYLPDYGYTGMGNYHKLIFGGYGSETVNLYGKTLREVLPATEKQDIPMLAKIDADISAVRLLTFERLHGRKCIAEDLCAFMAWRFDNFSTDRLLECMEYVSLHKAIAYLSTHKERIHSSSSVTTWRDYLGMAKKAGWDMDNKQVLLPADLERAHDMAQTQCKVMENAVYDAEILKRKNEYEIKFGFSKDDFCIVVPEKSMDIISEGQKLSHCVGHYVKDVAAGKTIILFVRHKDFLEQPLYTVEVSTTNKIIQCRGKRNCAMTPEVKAFVEAFKKSRLHIQRARVAV